MNELLSRVKILAPLRLRAFRILWAGMTVSLIGDGVTLVAIAWQVYQLSNVPTALGITMVAMSVPQILLLLFGGLVSDRFERRRAMLFADLVRGLALLAMGVLSITGVLEIWHMAVIAAIYGAGNAFFGPAFDAMVPDLVPDDMLAQANALDQFVRPVAARLLGPALGGWIISAVGVGWAFVVDAASFAVSIACLLRLGSVQAAQRIDAGSHAQGAAQGTAETGSIWADIAEGFAFVRSDVRFWGTYAAATLAYLVFLGPAEVLLPFLIKNEMGGSASDLGMVFAMGGLGAVSASVVMAQRGMPRRNMRFIYVAWSVATLSVAGYGLANFPWQVMLACFAFNALETAGLIVWLTTRQTLVPTRLLGRVSSLEWLISIGLMPLSYALAGPFAVWWGTRPTLIGAGVLGAVITLAFLFLPGMRAAEKRVPFRLSRDPLFVEKVCDIVGLYFDPPLKAMVLCVDEKIQVQALDRTQPVLPLSPGVAERRSHDYMRHGTKTLFEALDIAAAELLGVRRRHRSRRFLQFLRTVEANVPPGLDIHLLMDRYSTHKAPSIQAWFERHPRFHIHFTPTSATWLDHADHWFATLTEKYIRRGTGRSTRQLEQAIRRYLDIDNANPKPFVWAKSGHDIHAAIERFCVRISNARHSKWRARFVQPQGCLGQAVVVAAHTGGGSGGRVTGSREPARC